MRSPCILNTQVLFRHLLSQTQHISTGILIQKDDLNFVSLKIATLITYSPVSLFWGAGDLPY